MPMHDADPAVRFDWLNLAESPGGLSASVAHWLSQLTHLPVVAHLSFASLNAPM